jgi:hypothetical protein
MSPAVLGGLIRATVRRTPLLYGKEPVMAVRQCPECELRFLSEQELRDHLDSEHPGSVSPPPSLPPTRPGG